MEHLGGILAGAAALGMMLVNLINTMNQRKRGTLERIENDLTDIKADLSVTKEASFYALQGHVEQGVNGDVKKAHTRLRKNIFED